MYVYRRRPLTVLQAILDIVALWLIWRLTIDLRISLDPLTVRQVSWTTAALWAPSKTLVLGLWFVVSLRLRLYRVPDHIRLSSVAGWAVRNTLAICIVTVLATFFSQQFGAGTSRLFVVCLAPVAFLTLLLTRGLALLLVNGLQHKKSAPRIALVGDLQHAEHLVNSLEPRVAKTIHGVIIAEPDTWPRTGAHQLRVLGTTTQLAELVNREHIGHVIIMKRSLPDAEIEYCKKILWRMNLPVSYALDLPRELKEARAGLRLERLELSQQYGLPTVDLHARPEGRHHDFIKRIFDLTLAGALLSLLAPVLLLLAIFARVCSAQTGSGPRVLERKLHLGKGGRHFNSLRFRFDVPAHRPRSLALANLFRRYRLDELPQLANVARGRVSFVGPAALPVDALDTVVVDENFSEWQQTRALVQPGLTGLWQVQRIPLSFEDLVELDMQYVRERSFWFDMAILFRTPAGIVRGIQMPEYSNTGAYSFAGIRS